MSRIYNTMFLDIETTPATHRMEELSEAMQHLWHDKFEKLRKRMPNRYGADDTAATQYLQSAGIFAEFGRVVCISVGFIFRQEEENHLRIKSIAGKNEKELLENFNKLVEKFFTTSQHNFCGHNIKEFDIPYLCRRMLIHNIPLPKPLQIYNKKPWEVNLLDTMDFWKFGDYKNYTSLKLLSEILGITTSKDDIDGSDVAHVFYEEDNLNRIVTYCEKDVLTTTQIWLRLIGKPTISPDKVTFIK